MPLSTVCVSTVNKRPRTWSSYTNIRARDEEDLIDMNATEEITVYKEPKNNYQSPRLARRTLGYGYDFPEKSPKKDKKWSISSIFRRKKKEESDSSSEEDSSKKGFLNRSRKKKPDGKRKKHVKTLGTFDHVVVPPCPRNSLLFNGNSFHDDSAVLSDPTGGFSSYTGRPRPVCMKDPAIDYSVGSGSVDSVNNKKSKKVLVKARAEARRTSSKNGSSSEEDSQRSNSSLHVRSEENLKARDTPTNRKSRAARTERYLKRHSRDGENPHNYLRLSKSDAENTTSNWKLSDDSNRSPSRSPLVPTSVLNGKAKVSFTSLSSQNTNISGLSTIPPSHASTNRFRVSNSTSNPPYKQSAQSINDYNNSTKKVIDIGKFFPDQRSVSCDANIHKAPSTEFTESVLNVQLPIVRPNTKGYRNLSLIDPAHLKIIRQPPPPPPRDPNRLHFFDGGRPNSYYFDTSGQSRAKSFNTSTPHHVMPQRKLNSFNLNPNLRSTSEDCLPRDPPNLQLATRPSSATPESGKPQRFISRRAGTVASGEELNYLADKNPRSRKPIFVQYGSRSLDNNTPVKTEASGGQKALNFWKQIDQKNMNAEKTPLNKIRSNSPQIFTSHTRIQTQVFLPSVLQTDMNNANTANGEDARTSSPFKPISPITPTKPEPPSDNVVPQKNSDDVKRKSSNLEEALDELEAIYNSLRLGDEDLLERAEQRERETQAKKYQLNLNAFPNYSARGALSDSSFSYEPFDTVDSPRRKRLTRKNRTVDIKHDDMAFRKLNKERSSTISDPQSVISKVSYLLASPIHAMNGEEEKVNNNSNEPDITYDDVVYRNIKRANNNLKVVEPQPPFGIPLGPITPAANSDYLHAKPDNIYRPLFKHKKIPDIVKDDLAFRNLRKDGNKGPSLPPLSAEDYKNNNSDSLSYLKKKRAQRSLSANIGNLIQNENVNKLRISDKEDETEYKTLTHIADAMEIARRVLKEKENRISATRKAFMSDTDTQYLDSREPISGIDEERRNFLNGLKARTLDSERNRKASSPRLGDNVLLCKPPRGRSPKESTPIPLSPLDDKKSARSESTSSSLDDLLNALAEEAKETTERITNELKLLAEENEKRSSLKREDPKTKDEQPVDDSMPPSENKLLDTVVDSKELMTSAKDPDEVVEQIEDTETVTEAANLVLSRVDSKDEQEDNNKSDHDYENLVSDDELNVDKVMVDALDEREQPVTCRSPFEEHKQELIASFQELKENMKSIELPRKKRASQEKEVESIYDNVEELKDTTDKTEGAAGKNSANRSRSRTSKWLRSPSFDARILGHLENMSENQETRTDRVARYKEERRRQLAAQFGPRQDNDVSSTSSPKTRAPRDAGGGTSSSSEGPRPTRASKLRLAALSNDNLSVSQGPGGSRFTPEKSTSPSSTTSVSRKVERDKSSKRKSNLNRSLTSEEVPPLDYSEDAKSRRRRRRFFPPEVLEQSVKESPSEEEKRNQLDSNLTASFLSHSPSSPITASSPTTFKHTPKKTELSIHMENARRSVTPSFSELGKYKPYAKRAVTSSPKQSSSPRNSPTVSQPSSYVKYSATKDLKSDSPVENKSKIIANRMDELSALTKQTLARVERLANKVRESPKLENVRKATASSPIKQIEWRKSYSRKSPSVEKSMPSSILKKKSLEEPAPQVVADPPSIVSAGPVSILKRKGSHDDHNKYDGSHSSSNTTPVTFSPSVVEPSTSKRKQGILKRRSLDESTVMRHRSCSPDVANKFDSRSILKNQRRSSLEELRRTQSPEIHLHGILKRKTSRTDDEDHSLNSPQGILKRRSGASSAGSTASTPHVSITTAVILAAAGGAEMVLQPENEPVKPILKKKGSDDHAYSDVPSEAPKPILKKKSSTDTDEPEEKPRPILKLPKSSMDRETLDTGQESRETRTFREESPRPRLSFCAPRSSLDEDFMRQRTSRRSHTICTDFNLGSLKITTKEEDRLLKKPRPLSVHELVKSFETTTTSTGAIPKRSSLKRNSDRYRTQPVTSVELEQSRNLVKSPQLKEDFSSNRSYDFQSLLDFTTSFENDTSLNSFFQSPLRNPPSPESFGCTKMSSDSAFQSLGDGLELEQDEEIPPATAEVVPPQNQETSAKPKMKFEPFKLEMKAIAEEAKKMRLGKGNIGIDRYKSRKSGTSDRFPSRFSTQPVTFEEVQVAARIGTGTSVEDSVDDENDPSKMSLMDRIRMFEKTSPVKVRRSRARFSTEIVSADEIASARSFFSKNKSFALDDLDTSKSSERKSILKPSPADAIPKRTTERKTLSPPAPKSALKKRESWNCSSSSTTKKPTIKVETSPDKDDEGISCNDSASDSDSSGGADATKCSKILGARVGTDSTSEGESSGGREIKSIFKNENKLNFKLKLENVLSKSKSHGAFDDNDTSLLVPKKKVTVRRSHTENEMPQSIADLRAKLKERGESEWRKRVPLSNNANDELKLLKEKNRYNDELSEKSLLAAKKDELDASSRHWKSRVEKSDAEKFSVAGKMHERIRDATPTINIKDVDENEKRTPQAKRFKLKGTDSTPSSPEKGAIFDLTRSKSVPYSPVSDLGKSDADVKATPKKVSVPNPDDLSFQKFFKSFEQLNNTDVESVEVSQEDFDAVQRQSLLVIRKNVQVQKRRGATRNPIKALAARTDITNEYTEVITGVAEREKKRLNIENLAKNSTKALEALAGLASNEDFKSIALRKSPTTIGLLPWKDLMLLQIKGRRHVQTRLVEPIASNINDGDCFILITPTALYNYIGTFANIIEQSRAADVANLIQKTSDMGCKVSKVITITKKDTSSKHFAEFWKLLGADEPPEEFIGGGHPDEDETYESNILHTNMIYSFENDELVPHDTYWGTIPKIEILKETSILVFDFGSELYMWSGKNAPLDKKRSALNLAKKLWEEGYDYTECNVCPLNVSSLLGDRKQESLPLECDKRPDWALFAKITQHRETVLFKEKFLDWPDFSRVIRVKSDENIKEVNASYDIQPCDVTEMLKEKEKEPDLVVDSIHLGRGQTYWDEETRRLFEYETRDVKGWRILENTYEPLKEESLGHFYDGDSYIYCWNFKQTVRGRELSGLPSKRAAVGRDRSIFFCWQGTHSSVNEKGTAACLTVELDKQNAPQVRVEQGTEPAAFLRLFKGNMVIHNGKRDEVEHPNSTRMFILRGEVEVEAYLMEVPLKMSSLRSRSSFVIINTESDQISIWHGSKSSSQKRKVAKDVVDKVLKAKPAELCLDDYEEDPEVVEMEEGSESEDLFDAIGNDRNSYVSLLESDDSFDYTIKMFRLSSVTGEFVSTEVLCPHRSEHSSPYPFVQSELYSARQPALFLIDNHHELWLWQGWWPETEEELDVLSDQTGSGAVRWQAERKAAMQTALSYWKASHDEDEPVVAFLVWAGMEPLKFKNLFPAWEHREDVEELNKKEGKKSGDLISLETELALLSRSTYPLVELLQRPLPEGVDPTNIEKYLSPEDFQELLSMSKEDFDKLPSWKKTALKKEKGLF